MRKLNNIGNLLETPRYTECYTNLANNRIIFVSEDITKDTASSISALLLYYDQESEVDDISMYINTNGGDAGALTSIYDMMQLVSAPIKTVCIGKAYSAGAFILAAGTKGKRLATRNASVMIHGIQAYFPPGEMRQSEIYMKFLQNNNDTLMKLLAKHTNKTLETIIQDCSRDYFMSTKDALAYGIIDDII